MRIFVFKRHKRNQLEPSSCYTAGIHHGKHTLDEGLQEKDGALPSVESSLELQVIQREKMEKDNWKKNRQSRIDELLYCAVLQL